MNRSIVLFLLLAACASPTAIKIPSPPVGIARVVLVTDKGVVFTGKALPGQVLVAQVLDSAGRAVTDAVLTAQASPGWIVRGDTIIAPTTEGFGKVTITAARLDPSVATSDTALIASTLNLGTLRLTGSPLTCRVDVMAWLAQAGGNWNRYQGPLTPLPVPGVGGSGQFPYDSVVVVGTVVDSVNYAGSGDWRLTSVGWNLFGLVYYHAATLTYYENSHAGSAAPDDSVQTWTWVQVYGPGTEAAVTLAAQTPGTIALASADGVPVSAVNATPTGKASYVLSAAPFCGASPNQIPPSAITLTAN